MAIKRALVVDDSKSVQVMLRRMLEQSSLTVDTAGTAEEALDYLRSKRPDVIFMDHILPGMSGLEATKAITSDPATSAIPVIMHSSKDGEAFYKEAEAHGAAAVLPKPARPDTLSRVLQSINGKGTKAPAKPAPPATVVEVKLAPAPAAPPAAPAAPPAISAAQIESIARSAAEYTARSLATRLLEEQLGQLRQDVLTRAHLDAQEVAGDVFAARSNELHGQIRKLVFDQLTDQLRQFQATVESRPATPDRSIVDDAERIARSIASEAAAQSLSDATQAAQQVARQAAQTAAERAATTVATKVATDLYGARLAELSEQLRHAHDQIAQLRAALETPRILGADVQAEIKTMVRSAASEAANEAVQHATQKLARQAAQAAEQAAGNIARRVVDPLLVSVRATVSRMNVLAGAAALAGIVAAIIAYALK